MYVIGQVKGIHFCLLIFARGKWKKNYGVELTEKLQAKWLNIVANQQEKEDLSLFDPKKLGKKLKDCVVCSEVYDFLKNELGKDTGIILISHFVPEEAQLKSIFAPLMEDPQVQKMYYIEQNSAYFLMTPDQFIAKMKAIQQNPDQQKKVSITEFFRLVDHGQFETGVLYKIFPKLQY